MNTNADENVGSSLSLDRFEILRELGRGGSSIVYLVRSKESGALFAMKSLKPEYVPAERDTHAFRTCRESESDAGTERDTEELRLAAAKMLRTEAEILAELSGVKHGSQQAGGQPAGQEQSEGADTNGIQPIAQTGIPAYYGEICENGAFAGFLMEYVEGESLRDLLENGRVFTVPEAAEAGVQLCGILARLHTMDPPRIYRDLKPGNILVKGDGRYVLVDFGAVRNFREDAAHDTLPLGTEGYAAPEQYGGWQQSDMRTDVYGIGAVLHHMITGRPPLETGLRPLTELMGSAGDAQHHMRDGTQTELRPITKLLRNKEDDRQYAEMDKILLRACSVAPSMRFASCNELEKALRKLSAKWNGKGKENAWRKFVFLSGLSFTLLIGSGVFGATASGAEMNRYHMLLREAEAADSLDGKLQMLRLAVKIRPRDSEAYKVLLRGLAADGVLTPEEKEVLEDFLYENGYPGEMRKWRPAESAGLEMMLGKVYFGCYEGGTEAARRAFANAAEAAGSGRADRRIARAMCEVLGETWSADRIGAWKILIRETVSEALADGDGAFAASVCIRAAGEIALFPDRFVAAGADPADLREVAGDVRDFALVAESGWPELPPGFAEELKMAADALERAEGTEDSRGSL